VTAGITVRRVGFRALANNTDDRSCDHGGRNLKPRSGLNLRPTDRRVLWWRRNDKTHLPASLSFNGAWPSRSARLRRCKSASRRWLCSRLGSPV